jgi:spermidine/putrescine transport system ATP-binding protein
MGLTLAQVSKSYGSQQVLPPLDLAVVDGEFLTILGPSGSGKTTILKLTGGFTMPNAGRILFRGQDITEHPTRKRPFNTVFQDYALFPHMTAAQNIGYGLMVRGQPKATIARTVDEALGLVGLAELGKRYPSQLSGGQSQRVALARAIVCEPQLILLDEPLAALDAALRRQMQEFLKSLQRRIATTFLFVTHDQEEAIAMSDRIVVMNKGRIEQIGTPSALYYAPQTEFVAGFFGDNNLLDARRTEGGIETPFGFLPGRGGVVGPVTLAIRPERIQMGVVLPDGLSVDAAIESVTFVGATTQLRLRAARASTVSLLVKIASAPDRLGLHAGTTLSLSIAPDDVAVIPRGSA